MTPPSPADRASATRHVSPLLGTGDGVKGRSRRLPVREAQPLRPSPVPSMMMQPCDRPVSWSVSTVATGQLNLGERVKVKIDYRLQSISGRRTLKCDREYFEPRCIGSLQREQHSDGIVPALWAAAAIDRPMRLDRGRRLPLPVTRTIAGLALGIAQRCFALGFATTWHGKFSVT
jgi:hypothetical protein